MFKRGLQLGLCLVATAVIASACSKTEETGSTNVKPQGEAKQTAVHVSTQVEKSCMSCHAVDNNGKLARIEYVRKTPEGWSQTIARMERIHGLKITDDERKVLIKDLSEQRGLAPSEAEPVRYWVENKPSYVEADSPNLNVQNACMACHAGGRFMAQRRTDEEWKNLKDFHLVMFPSIYLNNRHVDWPKEADAAIAYLAKQYPEKTAAWDEWKGKQYDVQGKWKVVGFQGTKGFYIGDSEFQKSGDGYSENKSIRYLNTDSTQSVKGNVQMYSGYTLRSQYERQGEKLQGVFNVLENGSVVKGDWAEAKDAGITGEETYYKVQHDKPEIVHMEPAAIQQGKTNEITLYGMNLKKLTVQDMKLPKGVTVKSITSVSDDEAKLTVVADKSTGIGSFSIASEKMNSHENLIVYDKVDYLQATPSYAVARIGGASAMQKVSTQFVAYAYSNGKDGKKGTADDLKLMLVPAKWSLGPYPENIKNDEDLKYIGKMDENGLFTPSIEGVNKERPYTAENVGSVTAIATYKWNGKTFTGKAHLITAVPDYNNVVN
jgi:quinohemoprotein amine dehydrogenase